MEMAADSHQWPDRWASSQGYAEENECVENALRHLFKGKNSNIETSQDFIKNTDKGERDRWDFYMDHSANHHKWRWRRTAVNGQIVGAATQGYAEKEECEENAIRNGHKA